MRTADQVQTWGWEYSPATVPGRVLGILLICRVLPCTSGGVCPDGKTIMTSGVGVIVSGLSADATPR
jgi:hypothetical protein